MIVTYGKPLNYSLNYETYPTNLWDGCVRHCYSLDSCVAAHSPVSPITCEIFNANLLWSVKRMNSSQEQLMAIKIHSPSTICPVSMDSVLSYAEIFGSPNQSYIHSQAEQLCSLQNAQLSGLETQEERTFVMETALSIIGSNYPNFSAFWISGVRKPECIEDGWQTIPYCIDYIQEFTWSDNYLTNYSGIVWDLNQPDRNTSGYWQNCMQIWIREEFQSPTWNFESQPNGAADDAPCDEAENQYYAMRGYVCGKVAE
ncbi:hypothetical protein GCK72_012835 [Caenorhabditis remanei]|uniref:C-type lectin domain-containing protein n=1 Tax=Caenorhabditis remanei TaxID=31234 RepID=A0A6A5GPN5_CAERE|nr:hypothetical protein GCK72_012835 [Caenorhabditis remanei]KAF1756382.1 hypothetical protein GCK72_012835 [Caenorhabditis remanei]